MLSHNNLLSTLAGLEGGSFETTGSDVHLSYLPMAHIFERMMFYSILLSGGIVCIYNGDVLKLKEDLASVRPTIFASVPRLYNRFYDLIKGQFSSLNGIKKILANRAVSTKLYNLKHK